MTERKKKISYNLFKSTSIVSTMTLVSRVSGFLRDLVLAQAFGTVAGFDAFLIAFKSEVMRVFPSMLMDIRILEWNQHFIFFIDHPYLLTLPYGKSVSIFVFGIANF